MFSFGVTKLLGFGCYTTINLLICSIIIGFLYSKTNKKIIDKEFRLITSFYLTILTEAYVAIVFFKLYHFDVSWFRFIVSIMHNVLIKFVVIYYFLLLGSKLHRKPEADTGRLNGFSLIGK